MVGGSHPGKETAAADVTLLRRDSEPIVQQDWLFTDSQPRLASPVHSQIQCQLSPVASLAVHVSADYASHVRLAQ